MNPFVVFLTSIHELMNAPSSRARLITARIVFTCRSTR